MTRNAQYTQIMGFCGIVGGILYFLTTALSEALPADGTNATMISTVSNSIATFSFALLLLGFLGILWTNALNGWFGKLMFWIATIGYALMSIGAVFTIFRIEPLTDPETAVSLIYLLGRLIAVVFTVLTGIAVLMAGRWQGWARFVPLLLGLWPLVAEVGYAMLSGGRPNLFLNAMWGLMNTLLGVAILMQSKTSNQTDLIRH